MENDNRIQRDVLDELGWEPSIEEARIGVAAENGVVTLTGEVFTFGQKHRAEKAAMRVRGVRAVANELAVDVVPKLKRTDAEIAQSALTALGLMVSVPRDSLKVVVRDGQVTLEGDVDWDYQRQAAARAVRDLAGVKGVVNLIRIRPRPLPRDVKQKIVQAFHRSAQLDADRVTAETDGGRVTLRGTVSSSTERTAAERAAWGAPGVTEVRNLLAVESRMVAFT